MALALTSRPWVDIENTIPLPSSAVHEDIASRDDEAESGESENGNFQCELRGLLQSGTHADAIVKLPIDIDTNELCDEDVWPLAELFGITHAAAKAMVTGQKLLVHKALLARRNSLAAALFGEELFSHLSGRFVGLEPEELVLKCPEGKFPAEALASALSEAYGLSNPKALARHLSWLLDSGKGSDVAGVIRLGSQAASGGPDAAPGKGTDSVAGSVTGSPAGTTTRIPVHSFLLAHRSDWFRAALEHGGSSHGNNGGGGGSDGNIASSQCETARGGGEDGGLPTVALPAVLAEAPAVARPLLRYIYCAGECHAEVEARAAAEAIATGGRGATAASASSAAASLAEEVAAAQPGDLVRNHLGHF